MAVSASAWRRLLWRLRRPAPQRFGVLWTDGTSTITARPPGDPEETRQTVYGPRIEGYCSECQGPMLQAVTGVNWHRGPNCHWHIKGSGCCRFIPLPPGGAS
jgi:hypothetical protein